MSSNTEILKKEQLKYISKSYKVGKDTEPSEIINILNDYAWTRDIVVGSASSVDIASGER